MLKSVRRRRRIGRAAHEKGKRNRGKKKKKP
jgi:hypothetical protein